MKVGDYMKIKPNIFIIIISIFMFINIFNVKAYASYELIPGAGGTVKKDTSTSTATTINPDNYIPTANTDTTLAFQKAGVVLGAIRNISAAVSVIALMVIGFRYILGSVEEKANYKQTMIPYIIGCIMAVAGTTLVTFIYNAVID